MEQEFKDKIAEACKMRKLDGVKYLCREFGLSLLQAKTLYEQHYDEDAAKQAEFETEAISKYRELKEALTLLQRSNDILKEELDKERNLKFSLSQMIECFEAGKEGGYTQARRDLTDSVSNYEYMHSITNAEEYFKQTFNINIPNS